VFNNNNNHHHHLQLLDVGCIIVANEDWPYYYIVIVSKPYYRNYSSCINWCVCPTQHLPISRYCTGDNTALLMRQCEGLTGQLPLRPDAAQKYRYCVR